VINKNNVFGAANVIEIDKKNVFLNVDSKLKN